MLEQIFFKLVVIIGPLILAVSVHEFSHALMANWLGDDLGKRMGRLTLDPSKHIDPVWTVGLPAFLIVLSTLGGLGMPLFAAGKPTPYNPLALNRKIFGQKIPLKYAELLVAIAGPLSNLLLAFISMLLILLLSYLGYPSLTGYSVGGLLFQFINLNVVLFIFNLIPVPPLDGSKVLAALLPRRVAERYEAVGPSLSWILLGLLIFAGGGPISSAVRVVVSGLTWFLI